MIIGAGVAGAVAALNLARSHRVLLIDRTATPAERIGESLPAAAGPLLRDMGLWADFLADGHAPSYARRSRWGSNELTVLDTLRDPHGDGWRLDRQQFERRLRATAVARGAQIVAPARLAGLARSLTGWLATVERDGVLMKVNAQFIIDASGRGAAAMRPFGQIRRATDRLACCWQILPQPVESDGTTYVESTADGWWYTAPLPRGRRIIAFHGDADLPALREVYGQTPLRYALQSDTLAEAVGAVEVGPEARAHICVAHSAQASNTGAGWLATGDAALAFDPLSSQGLFNALYTGLAAAQTAAEALAGDAQALPNYSAELAEIWRAYQHHHRLYYAQEQRWPASVFWMRRNATAASALA